MTSTYVDNLFTRELLILFLWLLGKVEVCVEKAVNEMHVEAMVVRSLGRIPLIIKVTALEGRGSKWVLGEQLFLLIYPHFIKHWQCFMVGRGYILIIAWPSRAIEHAHITMIAFSWKMHGLILKLSHKGALLIELLLISVISMLWHYAGTNEFRLSCISFILCCMARVLSCFHRRVVLSMLHFIFRVINLSLFINSCSIVHSTLSFPILSTPQGNFRQILIL